MAGLGASSGRPASCLANSSARVRAWAFEGGPPVAHEDYYLRAQPTFETPKGPHDWLTRHVFIGIGERRPDGNVVRYFAVL